MQEDSVCFVLYAAATVGRTYLLICPCSVFLGSLVFLYVIIQVLLMCAYVCVCVCVCLRGHAVDQAPQLFDHCLYQLLFISVVLPELREDVVLLTGVLHPGHRETDGDSYYPSMF